jgi:hypothetical protein
MSSRFWPVAEPAQADYEQLRALALDGERLDGLLVARRFARLGLAGLVRWPAAEPEYLGSVVGAGRPGWCGSEDPRERRLRDVYGFLLAGAESDSLQVVGE